MFDQSERFPFLAGAYHLAHYIPRARGVRDPLSESLLKFKDNDTDFVLKWAKLAGAECVKIELEFDLIVRVLGSNETNGSHGAPLDNIGSQIAGLTGAKYIANLLKKTRTNKSLKYLGAVDRAAELHGIYQFNGKYGKPNSSILIIDDIVTTGTTLKEVYRAIRESAPAAQVYFFSLAKTFEGYKDTNQNSEIYKELMRNIPANTYGGKVLAPSAAQVHQDSVRTKQKTLHVTPKKVAPEIDRFDPPKRNQTQLSAATKDTQKSTPKIHATPEPSLQKPLAEPNTSTTKVGVKDQVEVRNIPNAKETEKSKSFGAVFMTAIIGVFIYLAILGSLKEQRQPLRAHESRTRSPRVTGNSSAVTPGSKQSLSIPRNVQTARLDRETIRQAQQMLAFLGYYHYACDGIYGPVTAAAIADFEKHFKMERTGEINTSRISRMKKEFRKSPNYQSELKRILPMTVKVKVRAKIFSSPDSFSSVVGYANKGTVISLLDYAGQGPYWKVKVNGRGGYINSGWLERSAQKKLEYFLIY